MKPLSVSRDIVPIARFKARMSEFVRDLKERGGPVVVTQGGTPRAVLLAPEEFDRLMERANFVSAVMEGVADADAGRLHGDDEVEEILDREFGSSR